MITRHLLNNVGSIFELTNIGREVEVSRKTLERYMDYLKESYVFEQVDPDTGNVRGWWDDLGVRHIPKRKLEDLIID